MAQIVIRTFTNHIDADLASSALAAAGIQSFISADDAGGMRPSMWMPQGVRLLVDEADANDATEILNPAPEQR
ncbi:MAG: DUF2007 domain-containing protein [Acidobacteriaceae bacterium]|nr:DUF2007 domain-containing protein [Acidobacteriaceae bacterium]